MGNDIAVAWLGLGVSAATFIVLALTLRAAVRYTREATRQTEIQVSPYLVLVSTGETAYMIYVKNAGNGAAYWLDFEDIKVPPPVTTPIYGLPLAPFEVLAAGDSRELRLSTEATLPGAEERDAGSSLSVGFLNHVAPHKWVELKVRYQDLFGDSYEAGWRLRGLVMEPLFQRRVRHRRLLGMILPTPRTLNGLALCIGFVAALLLAFFPPPAAQQFTSEGAAHLTLTGAVTLWGELRYWLSYSGPALLALAFALQFIAWLRS